MTTAHRRVGVLRGSDRGTCLVPGLLLKTDGNMVEVLIEQDGGTVVERTCRAYADTPLPETAARWQEHYQRLEAANN